MNGHLDKNFSQIRQWEEVFLTKESLAPVVWWSRWNLLLLCVKYYLVSRKQLWNVLLQNSLRLLYQTGEATGYYGQECPACGRHPRIPYVNYQEWPEEEKTWFWLYSSMDSDNIYSLQMSSIKNKAWFSMHSPLCKIKISFKWTSAHSLYQLWRQTCYYLYSVTIIIVIFASQLADMENTFLTTFWRFWLWTLLCRE